jgi:hypothetical protein
MIVHPALQEKYPRLIEQAGNRLEHSTNLCGLGGYHSIGRHETNLTLNTTLSGGWTQGLLPLVRDIATFVERDADFRDRDWDRNRHKRYRDDRRAAPRGTGASGLDNAVNMCLDRIERDVRVDTVDNVERNGSGWQVSGVLFNGSAFQCRIGNSGQIDAIDYGQGFTDVGFNASSDGAAPRAAGQWDDQRYADARAAVGGTVRPDIAVSEATIQPGEPAAPRTAASTAMPAYPGGPIPGEVIPETIDEGTGG